MTAVMYETEGYKCEEGIIFLPIFSTKSINLNTSITQLVRHKVSS